MIVKASGKNVPIKILYFGGFEVEFPAFKFSGIPVESIPGAFAGTIFGHSNANGAITVGACNYDSSAPFTNRRSTIANYSSKGGGMVYFDTAGRKRTSFRLKPEIVATDKTNTSFFGFDTDKDKLPNFSGTSAAAPNAAALAALMIEKIGACRKLRPSEIKLILQATAEDMDDPLTKEFDKFYDKRTGFGHVQADKALNLVSPCQQSGAKVGEIITSINITPNPVIQQFNVELQNVNYTGNVTITVNDITGSEILNRTTFYQKGALLAVDASSFATGVYVVSVQAGDNKFVQRFVKQ
jgi:hypothetical protein